VTTASGGQAYFYFPELVVHQPGRYRARVPLMKIYHAYEYPDGVGSVGEYADRHLILVEEGASRHARPSFFHSTKWRRFADSLKALEKDNSFKQYFLWAFTFPEFVFSKI
jgi:hypothetical protein